ncbi:MAG: DUF2852 domain-containing protein [Granulosicoccus sp.]|nr:DUF2852 domain-containing protein [Granulosicoccus sp.]
MSSSSSSTVDQKTNESSNYDNGPVWSHFAHRCGNGRRKGNWSTMNIAAMVLGFVLFWPVGLIVLFWIMAGRNAVELPEAIRNQWSQMRGFWREENDADENVIFREYQQTQYDRIQEIKDEIKSRSRRFSEFRASAKRRADQEEFNRFMADSPSPIDG